MGSIAGSGLLAAILAWGAPVVLLAVVTIRFVRRRQKARRRATEAMMTGASAPPQPAPPGPEAVPMRRGDRRVTDPARIATIVAGATVCQVALARHDEPYLVAMSFGAEARRADGAPARLYFHCAGEGRKLSMLRENPRVCFQITGRTAPVRGSRPCDWSVRYETVVGYGLMAEVTDESEKRRGLEALMAQQGAAGPFDFPDAALQKITVLRLDVTELSCKSNWPAETAASDPAPTPDAAPAPGASDDL